jgi:hypothetical protein
LTLPKPEIVDCGAFCEVFFFHISHENLLGDFSYRLNDSASPLHQASAAGGACMPLLCASRFFLTSVGKASSQDEQKYAPGDATHCGISKEQREAFYSHPVPVVETETDIARCQGP